MSDSGFFKKVVAEISALEACLPQESRHSSSFLELKRSFDVSLDALLKAIDEHEALCTESRGIPFTEIALDGAEKHLSELLPFLAPKTYHVQTHHTKPIYSLAAVMVSFLQADATLHSWGAHARVAYGPKANATVKCYRVRCGISQLVGCLSQEIPKLADISRSYKVQLSSWGIVGDDERSQKMQDLLGLFGTGLDQVWQRARNDILSCTRVTEVTGH